MKTRKFEIINVVEDLGGSGPDRFFKIKYKGIQNKKWIEKELFVSARNKDDARNKAIKRFGNQM
jgi:hypothetical protein